MLPGFNPLHHHQETNQTKTEKPQKQKQNRKCRHMEISGSLLVPGKELSNIAAPIPGPGWRRAEGPKGQKSQKLRKAPRGRLLLMEWLTQLLGKGRGLLRSREVGTPRCSLVVAFLPETYAAASSDTLGTWMGAGLGDRVRACSPLLYGRQKAGSTNPPTLTPLLSPLNSMHLSISPSRGLPDLFHMGKVEQVQWDPMLAQPTPAAS